MLKIVALLQAMFLTSGSFAAEWPTEQALRVCRMELSEKGAQLVGRWSTKPLPPEYRKAISFVLRSSSADGWTEYMNPNGALTIVIRTVTREPPKERGFEILIRNNNGLVRNNNGRVFHVSVAAFEFARSGSANKEMTGLFFCGKHGPSAEWVWDGADWHVAR